MAATFITITSDQAGQRIDNFLITRLKGLPKTRIYRALRKGEVRVNKGRVKPEYKIQTNDVVRIPPVELPSSGSPVIAPSKQLASELEQRVMYENQQLLIINKPSGLAVHGGTQISAGLIEMLRVMRPEQEFLELVHRLDRQKTGCLIIAKKRSTLVDLHRQLTGKQVKKRYLLLVKGVWTLGQHKVDAPLLKNVCRGGERMVTIHDDGKAAATIFRPIRAFKEATLLEANLITGRTHQIRVHAASLGHPVAGDVKYGDNDFNKAMQVYGLQRLFLHSASISCTINSEEQSLSLCAPLDRKLLNVLNSLPSEE